MFELEKLYNRRKDIHGVLGGQMQGGIATPTKSPIIILFTGEAGEAHGYHDGYDENGLFIYTGEGQEGHMQFVRGNKAIRDHIQNGKELLLFSAAKKKGMYRFKGSYICAGYDDKSTGSDTNGAIRRLIRFQLVFANEISGSAHEEALTNISISEKSIEELRIRAYAAGQNQASASSSASKRKLYKRSLDVKAYVLARAKGICESCDKPAPFQGKNGQPYLEAHHIRRLSDDGLDIPSWMAAVCPSCHSEIHQGENGKIKNDLLRSLVFSIEDPMDITLVSDEN